MFSVSNLVTIIEILVAEIIFLYSFPRREKFLLRFILSVVVGVGICCFLPQSVSARNEFLSDFYTVFRFMFLFGISLGVMILSFRASFSAVLSACSAGYAVEHLSSRLTMIISVLFPSFRSCLPPIGNSTVITAELIVLPVVYTMVFFIFGRLVAKRQIFKNNKPYFNIISIAMVAVCIVFSRFDSKIGKAAFAIALCIFALLVQIILHRAASLQEENSTIKRVMEETSKRYEASKENIDLINIKCHDLKYKLRALGGQLPQEEIDAMINCINIYDRTVETGNEALDTVLADKTLSYQKDGIEFTFMGDGKELSFMSAMDTYSLFGNALDNAIEAVKLLEDKEKRVISLTIERRGELVMVNVSNFFEGKIEFQDDVPVTSKRTEQGYHGFGMKSIKLIAEKYHGKMNINVAGNTFNLSIGFLR